MASIGYGYGISQLQHIAADYAKSLKKPNVKSTLSKGWVQAFLKRYPEDLKVVKPQKLSLNRAKCASAEVIRNYFHELHHVLLENDLLDKPQHIFNVDESGFSTEHRPPKIVCGKQLKPQSVVSEKSKNVTIIGSANAIGNHVPPFYVFPGKRWMDELLQDCTPGSDGDMSESGFVNRGLFEHYMTKHFSKHVNLKSGNKTLVLYDGHKAHMSLTLTDWAKENDVVLFVLPPHSSHLTQPLDVGIFGPMKHFFYSECKLYMHANPGMYITRYEIAKLTAKPYAKAFSPENIASAFKKAGIYPYCPEVIVETDTAPAEVYPSETTPSVDEVTTTELPASASVSQPVTQGTPEKSTLEMGHEFLESKKITSVVKSRPKKKFVPPIKIVGNLLSETNLNILKENHDKAVKKEKYQVKTVKSEKSNTKKSKHMQSNTNKNPIHGQPMPSTSGLNKNKGGPIMVDESESEDFSSEDESEPCCQCKHSFPPHLKGYPGLVILKWAQCDKCGHWVHLTHCCATTFIRRGASFICECCK
jgi:hypothetical protein